MLTLSTPWRSLPAPTIDATGLDSILKAEEELDRLSKTMGFMEKGKIRVKGLLEVEPSGVPPAPRASAVEAVAKVKEEPTPQEVET